MIALRAIGMAAACLAASSAFALGQGEYRFNGFGTLGMTYLGGEEDGRSYGIQGQTTDSCVVTSCPSWGASSSMA